MKKIYSFFLLLGLLLSVGNVWAAFEKASSIAVGDQVVFVYETGSKELTSISSTQTPYGVGTAYTTTPNGTWAFEVVAGNSNGTFAFKNGDDYLCWESGNSLKVSTSVSANSSWVVSFNNGNAIILNAKDTNRKLQWNGTNPRFACYTSAQTQIQLYKMVNASVAAPVFSPVEGSYFEAQNVTITCPTNGAAIYYTLDGTDPTNTSNLYTTPIAIGETKTIKAIAILGNESSSIASATYTIVTLKTLAEVRAQATGVVLTQGVVTSSSSDGKTVYIQDANAGIVVYSTSDLSLTIGDEISVSGTLTNYKGLLEITGPEVNVLSSGNTVTPTVKTIAEINADTEFALQGLLVKIEDATVTAVDGLNTTIAQGNSSIVVRGISANPAPAVNDVVTLTGNIGCYTVAQIANPTDIQIETPVADPVINAQNVDLADNATSGEIEYTITNPVQQVSLTAATNTGWISNISVTADKVTFTTTVNTENIAREGFITLSYTGATDKVVTIMQAAHEDPNYTWDLSTNSYFAASADQVSWSSAYATIVVDKASASTDANNYLPTANTSSRFYKNSSLTIAPTCGYTIKSVVFTATTNGYASALQNSSWTNATAVASEKTVTVTPTSGRSAISATIGGTCGFTAVKVYYEGPSDTTIVLGANGWSTFSANYKFSVSGAEVYMAKVNGNQTAVVLHKVENGIVPADEGVILKGEQGQSATITPTNAEASDYDDNLNDLWETAEGLAYFSASVPVYVLSTFNGVTAFNPCDDITIPLNKAYLNFDGLTPAPGAIRIEFAENNATDIKSVEGGEVAVKFLENGKLYIQKDGVVYDVTGAMVK